MNEKTDRQSETPASSPNMTSESPQAPENTASRESSPQVQEPQQQPAPETPPQAQQEVPPPEAQPQAQQTPPSQPPPQPQFQPPPERKGGNGFSPWIIVAVLALGLAGWQWMETRDRLADTQQEVARRLANGDAVVKESQSLSRQSQEQLAALQTRLGELENRLAESKSQQETLENLYQNLARNNDESMLIDIEQSMTSASEQLQLAGNVQGAVFALQSADSRLAGSSRPQFISLRKVLARDLERLRALPQADLPGTYMRLENVMTAVDSLPLANSMRPAPEVGAPVAEAPPASPPSTESSTSSSSPLLSPGYWRALAGDLWKEVRGLVRIQRFDREEPPLLAPSQGFFLRENLKLRLLNARLALLSRDQWTYRNELQRAQEWLQRYFEVHDKTVLSNLVALKELSSTQISNELPNINESLSAIKNFRADKERERERR